MEMPSSDWTTDNDFFASLPGGQAVIDWFGFVPDFHDGTVDRLELSGRDALLAIKASIMTNKVDAKGYYVPDRHALVTLRIKSITGLKLEGDAGSVISELMIRRLPETPNRSDWQTCGSPVQGDIEIAFDTAIGLYGSIFGKQLEFVLQPLTN